MELKDRAAIVTGGSSGIGAAIARTLAEQGCHIAINYNRNADGAEQVATDCREFGVKVLVVQADVGCDDDCRKLVSDAVNAFGRLDVLINNAGTTKFCEHSKLDGLDQQDFIDIYRTNTIGAFQMVRAAEEALRQQDVAHVINMASIAAISGVGSSIAYAASKGALLTMTMSLARVLGPQIRVNAICPGFVQGEWLKEGLGEAAYEKMIEGLRRVAPLGDPVTPERVAAAALGIISSMDWATGESIILDGGAHLQTSPLRK